MKRLLQTVRRCREGLCTTNGESVLERLIFPKRQTYEKTWGDPPSGNALHQEIQVWRFWNSQNPNIWFLFLSSIRFSRVTYLLSHKILLFHTVSPIRKEQVITQVDALSSDQMRNRELDPACLLRTLQATSPHYSLQKPWKQIEEENWSHISLFFFFFQISTNQTGSWCYPAKKTHEKHVTETLKNSTEVMAA